MEFTRHYVNGSSKPLEFILNDVRKTLSALCLANDELRYRYELICEELIINSCTHAVPIGKSFDLTLTLSSNPGRIILKETGVQAIDPDKILEFGKTGASNIEQLNPGGLGIVLITRLAKNFSCTHDARQAANIFEVII